MWRLPNVLASDAADLSSAFPGCPDLKRAIRREVCCRRGRDDQRGRREDAFPFEETSSFAFRIFPVSHRLLNVIPIGFDRTGLPIRLSLACSPDLSISISIILTSKILNHPLNIRALLIPVLVAARAPHRAPAPAPALLNSVRAPRRAPARHFCAPCCSRSLLCCSSCSRHHW